MQWRMGNLRALQEKLSSMIHPETVEEKQEEEAANAIPASVRVLLMENDSQIYRNKVSIAGDQGIILDDGTRQWTASAGEVVTFDGTDPALSSGTTILTPMEGGQLFLVTEAGAWKQPGYWGRMEVWKDANGYALVNEVDTEQYLIGVLPSEMPESYGLEALKAQAVCARSYLYVQAAEEHYPQFHAHLNDTVAYQVYNHKTSGPRSAQAVQETKGQVLLSGNRVVEALYYSTSCGYTQSGSVFGADETIFQSVYVGQGNHTADIESYLRQKDEQAFEKEERYFRWTATIDVAKGRDNIVEKISQVHKKKAEDAVYSASLKKRIKDSRYQTTGEAFGKLTDFRVLKRNSGGVIETAELVFEGGSVTLQGELHIRDVLGAAISAVCLQNGEVVTGIDRLYSAAFVLDRTSDAWVLYGGGCGHGVGMSQNGAKALAEQGLNYTEILNFFYQNVEVQIPEL